MIRGKVRYDKSCDRWYVDLHYRGRRDKIYKYLGVMPCLVKESAEQLRVILNDEITKGTYLPGRHKRKSPMHLAEYARTWIDTLDIED